MYLSNTTHTLEIFADAAPATTNPQYHVSYNDHTSSGMTLPQSSSDGNLNGSTIVTALSAPASSTNRQVLYLTVYNADTATRIVTIQKSISGTKYIIIKSSLAPGATLEYSREHGWTVISQSTQNSHIITEFSSNGTWTRPANIKAAFICCVGAGGGGGSGARNAAGTNRFGGASGAGATASWQYVPVSGLSASYVVTVGTGGTGGTAITADNTNGNNGTNGGSTSFGSLIIAVGGSGGGGGTTSSGGTAGVAGQATANAIAGGPFSLNGTSGGTGTTNGTTSGSTGFNGTNACPAGAPGQGITNANVAGSNVTNGGGIYVNGIIVSGPVNGVAGSNNVARSLFFSSTLQSTLGIGTGGAGGNSANLNGTNGGYGAGGGGGAGTLNGTTSGAGGNGGGGICVVLEIY